MLYYNTNLDVDNDIGDYPTVTTSKPETPAYERASKYVNIDFGEKLEKIEGKDMLLHDFEYEDRGESAPAGYRYLVTLDLSTMDDPEVVVKFHAWSKSLGDRLEKIPEDTKFPLLISFVKAKTRAGFNVWTIE